GYQWHTFLTRSDATTDPSTFIWAPSGQPSGGTYTRALYDLTNTRLAQRNADSVGSVNLATLPPTQINFARTSVVGSSPGYSDIPDGVYVLGIACTNSSILDKYWVSDPFTVVNTSNGDSN